MSNAQFVRDSVLPPGWIDLGIGEARLIRRSLERTLGVDFLLRSTDGELDYQPSQGCPELLSEIELLHKAPCVVTTGAKQAVYAALVVAKQRGCRSVGMMNPAWPPLVHAAQTIGLDVVIGSDVTNMWCDCVLLVSPNNPDGRSFSPFELARLAERMKAEGKFLIHDGAYACAPYVNLGGVHPIVGDIQVHSVSKRFGLSGLRVGWAVARDEEVVAQLQDVIETMTAGVCGTAQGAVAKLLKRLRANPALAELFMEDARGSLELSRAAAREFNPEVLRVDGELAGAFAWCLKGPKYDPSKLRIKVVDGAAYGHADRVRVNLVGDVEDVRELAKRSHEI